MQLLILFISENQQFDLNWLAEIATNTLGWC